MADLHVFVSHSHKDRLLAEAFENALTKIFANVHVANSSSRNPGAGPVAGSDWLEWIHAQISGCQEALVLWTPDAAKSPWIMWEAGAVSGISLATGAPALSKPVTLIRFLMEEPPGPFVVQQVVDGTDSDEVRGFLGDLMRRHSMLAGTAIDSTLNSVLPPLLEQIGTWRASQPWGSETVLPRGRVVTFAEHLELAKETVHAVASTGKEFPRTFLEEVSRRGLSFQCLLLDLLDPNSPAATLWTNSYPLFRDRVEEIVRAILHLYTLPGAEVRLSKAYIANSMCATDLETGDSRMVVNFHLFGGETADRPFLQLDSSSMWHKAFQQQFKRLWDSAHPFRLRLAASGIRQRKDGLLWFPFMVPANKWGVVLDYEAIEDVFSGLSKAQDLIRSSDEPVRQLRMRLWPIVPDDRFDNDADLKTLVRDPQIAGRRFKPYPLVALDRLHFDFHEEGAIRTEIEILRYPELLTLLEGRDYRPPLPFFIADAKGIPGSLEPGDFRQQPDLPKKWSMSACKCCDREEFTVKFYVGPQRIVECRHCGLEMANPQPHVLDLRDSFKKYGRSYPRGPREALDSRARGYAEIFMQDIAERGWASNKPLVEFGSASGEFLQALESSGKWSEANLQGMDICHSSVALARNKGLRSREVDVEQMPPGSHLYEYVVMINTIEHFQDPLKVLQAARRMLTPTGRVFVANVPNSMSVNATVFPEGFISRNFPDGQHLFHFDPTSFQTLCNNAGFSVELLEKRKDIVQGRFDLAATWIAHQCGVDLRQRHDLPWILAELKGRLSSRYEDLAAKVRPSMTSQDLVELWRQHVWADPERSDCFDAWLMAI
jgi:2-polyprenyl-3-methyl-5-hydroxy-6-metoxy-1,4-benzoquinol methylase